MELKTRRIHLAGATVKPDGAWMKQVAREMTNCEDSVFNGKEHLIMDRDTKFTRSFRDMLKHAGTKCIVLPPRIPNLNAYIERFFCSLTSECLGKMIFFGGGMLRRTVSSFLEW